MPRAPRSEDPAMTASLPPGEALGPLRGPGGCLVFAALTLSALAEWPRLLLAPPA